MDALEHYSSCKPGIESGSGATTTKLAKPTFHFTEKGYSSTVGAESGFLITRWQYEQNWHHNKLKVKLEKKFLFIKM